MSQTNSNDLAGKVAVVTGASSGIGQAIAEHLGCAGAHVYLCGRTAEPMETSAVLIRETGGEATTRILDVRDVGALQAFIAEAADTSGGLHVMVNNAGVGKLEPIADGDPEHWREMLEVNVIGVAAGCQAAIRAMRATGSQGHIVNISSTAALRRESGMYGATKHAVNCINATLREELENDPIRVVSIMPGVFATNFARSFDRSLVEGLASSVGLEGLEFDDQNRLPRETIAELQARMAPVLGDVERIAQAVHYIITQPIELNIEELVIRPQTALPI
jgi:NADP-dependent 3-hydroxy acid dehydrogenase YdfG